MKEINSELKFILAKPYDSEQLSEMVCEFYKLDSIPFDKSKSYKALTCILEDEKFGKVFLFKLRQEIIGYIVITFGFSLEFHGRDAFIDEIYFREQYRGKGYGKMALIFAEQVCLEHDIKALHLEVEHTNNVAQSFYRKAEFDDREYYLMTKWIKQQNSDDSNN